MEQILAPLERQLRQLASLGPVAGAEPSGADPHVDRLAQGVAMLHARAALLMDAGARQMDEFLLDAWFPDQLRPFPPCGFVPCRQPPAARVVGARFRPGPQPALEFEFERAGPAWPEGLDVQLDGDAAFCAALRQALLQAESASWLDGAGGAGPQAAGAPFAPLGLTPEEALLPRAPGAHAGLALLREYFCFPRKFNLLRLDLRGVGAARLQTLRLPLPQTAGGCAALLQGLGRQHLRAGWRASADLSPAAAQPVAIDGRQTEYLLAAPAGQAIFAINRAAIYRDGQVLACAPLTAEGDAGPRWHARCVQGAAPGLEWRVAFSALPAGWDACTASFDLACCPQRGTQPAGRGAAARRQLQGLLALDHRPMDAAWLREAFALQHGQGMADAIHGLELRDVLLPVGRAAPLLGAEVRLTVDEACFGSHGLHLFGQVMDAFFAESARLNTFTRLVLLSALTGKELMRCKAR